MTAISHAEHSHEYCRELRKDIRIRSIPAFQSGVFYNIFFDLPVILCYNIILKEYAAFCRFQEDYPYENEKNAQFRAQNG